MIYKIIIIFEVIELSIAHSDNHFVVDYFKYKVAHHVAGFSCNSDEDNNDLVKSFSSVDIFSTVDKLRENKVTLRTYLSTMHRKLGIFLDSRCNSAEENENLLAQASELLLYGELHNWLILGDDLNETIEMLNDTEFSLSTDLVLAIAGNDGFVMYDVYNLCKYRQGILNVTLLGHWNSTNGLHIVLTQTKLSRRSNYHGMLLRMAVLVFDKPNETSMYDYLHDYAGKQNDTMPKFTFAVWEAIADLFNFTIELKPFESKKVANRNGPIIKMMSNREVELIVNTAIYTPERIDVVSASPVWPLRTCFMFRTTPSKKIKVNHFLRPLASATWYLTIVFTIAVVCVFASVLVVECGSNDFQRYSDAILFAIGSLCQQGTDLQATKAATRIALLQTMVFSLLLYNYYSASVVSARLSEPLEKINDSLNELAKTDLKFGAEPILYFNFYIQRSDWEGQQFYNRRWVKIPDDEKFMPADVGVRRILQGDFAYHIDVNVAFPKIERLFDNQHVCQLTFVHLVPPTDTCILSARNGSFVEMTRVGVARVRETGLRSRLIQKWAARTPRCRTDIVVIAPLTIYEVAPAFLVLAFGAMMGFFMCALEKTVAETRCRDLASLTSIARAKIRFPNIIRKNNAR